MQILTVNLGSSSVKLKLFALACKKKYEINEISQVFSDTLKLECSSDLYNSAVDQIFKNCYFKNYEVDVVIHRVVHGGDIYKAITPLTIERLEQLSCFNQFAPLHQPNNLALAKYFIQFYSELHKNITHYACFDTSFHQEQPYANRIYALPKKYTIDGIKRYGFHGLSYQYISTHLPNIMDKTCARGRWVIAHLGAGSSICGIKNGKSIVTTMGFSAVDGLSMATRCGELDPIIPGYIGFHYNLSQSQVDDILYHKSGLLALSGDISGDIQVLLKSNNPQALFAVDFFCMQCASYIAKLATVIGGMDGIIFTGGVGEHSSYVRACIISNLKWLKISLNSIANKANKLEIQRKDSSAKVLVVPTNEELAMIDQFRQYVINQQAVS